MTMQNPSQILEVLRQGINAGTIALAMNRMLDDEATKALSASLQTLAPPAFAVLRENHDRQDDCQRQQRRLQRAYGGGDDEGITVVPLRIPGNIAEERNPIIFSAPFVLAPFTTCSDDDPFSEYQLAGTCAVAVYNMALATHMRSFLHHHHHHHDDDTRSRRRRDESLLHEAKTLYLRAIDLVDRLDLDPEGSLIQIYLAVANNLAELYRDLRDDTEAVAWQTTLSQSFWSVPPAVESPVYRHFGNVVTRCYAVSWDA